MPPHRALDAQLVGAPGLGLEVELDEVDRALALGPDPDMREGLGGRTARRLAGKEGLGARAPGTAAAGDEKVVPGPAEGGQAVAPHADREVALGDGARGEGLARGDGGDLGGGEQQDAAGGAVQAVDEPDPADAALAVAHVVGLLLERVVGVEDGAGVVLRTVGVREHLLGFVHRHQAARMLGEHAHAGMQREGLGMGAHR